jgi:tetratricopeptide (TPR) repeat protein
MALNANGAARTGRLKSWKEIAAYFGADERTVKRWEAKRGLPIHRPPGLTKATVYADVGELEGWLNGKSVPAPAPHPRRLLAYAVIAAGALALGAWGLSLRSPATPAAAATHHRPAQAVADLYFAARYNLERRTPESLNRAVQLFTAAIRRDPQYAAAFAGLANCHLLLREYAGVPDGVAYPRARAAAQRALALDEGLADAQAALAFVAFFFDRDFAAGLDGFRRAIALDPGSAGARHWYASALYHAGRIPAALAQIDEAQRLDPQSQSILADKALILFAAGRTTEATALLRQMEAADPDYLSPHAYLAAILLQQRDYPGYVAEAATAARLTGDADQAAVAAAAARGYAAGGAEGMYRAMIERQRALYAQGREHAVSVAQTYALAGRRDEAMAALAAAVRDRDPYLVGIRVDSRLAGLRELPAFRQLELSVGGA